MRTALISIAFLAAFAGFSQDRFRRINPHAANLPEWAQLMYGTDPDVRAVESAYKAYFREHPFENRSHEALPAGCFRP